ncbi:MAG: MATE family efflux transporter [Bradymonadales bacterium]
MSSRKITLGEVMRLSYPIIISMASISLMGITDALFMGWIGPREQGAVGLGGPIVFSLLSIFYGTWSGVTTFVAQAVGAKQYKLAGKILWHAIALTIPCLPIVFLGINPLTEFMLDFFGTNPEIMPHAKEYMKIRLFAASYLFAGFVGLSFLRGIADMRSPAIITFIALLANVPLTYVMSFGYGPIKAMGVSGAAYATIIAQGIETLLYFAVIWGPKNAKHYFTRKIPRLDLKLIRRFLYVSFPIGVSWSLENVGWLSFTLFVATQTKEALAANTIVIQLLNLSFMPGIALSIAAATLVGQCLGANDPKNARRATNYAILLAVAIMGSIGLLCLVFREPIAGLFTNDPEVIQIAGTLFIFGAVYQVFDAVSLVSSGALRGAGDTRFPMAVSIVAIWFGLVPGVFFVGATLGYGIYGAWAAATAIIVLLGVIYYARYRQGKWQTMRALPTKAKSSAAA